MYYLFFGIQGSGKGTQTRLLEQEMGYKVFETGAALRQIAAEDSELGRKVKSIIEAGNLVPTEIVMEIVADFLDKNSNNENIIFDGIPRSKDQQEQLHTIFAAKNQPVKAILISLSREESLERLTTRRLCSQCQTVYPAFYQNENCEKCNGQLIKRSDDNEESIRRRIETFFEQTEPILKVYEDNGQLIKINGAQAIDAVYADIKKAL